MSEHKWTCKNCDTPNILVYNSNVDGQHTLNCVKCGAPGIFDQVSQSIIYTGVPSDNLITSTCYVAPLNIGEYHGTF